MNNLNKDGAVTETDPQAEIDALKRKVREIEMSWNRPAFEAPVAPTVSEYGLGAILGPVGVLVILVATIAMLTQ